MTSTIHTISPAKRALGNLIIILLGICIAVTVAPAVAPAIAFAVLAIMGKIIADVPAAETFALLFGAAPVAALAASKPPNQKEPIMTTTLLPLPEPTDEKFRPSEKDHADARKFAAAALASPVEKYNELCKKATSNMESEFAGVYRGFIRRFLARAQALRELIEQRKSLPNESGMTTKAELIAALRDYRDDAKIMISVRNNSTATPDHGRELHRWDKFHITPLCGNPPQDVEYILIEALPRFGQHGGDNA